MNKYCIGLLIISLLYVGLQTRFIREGFKVPAREIPDDLKDYLKMGAGGHMEVTHEAQKDTDKQKSDIYKKYKHLESGTAEEARHNFDQCKDTNSYHSCNVDYRKPPPIDLRYVNLPPTKLDTSNIYNHLSICPKTYETNMDILRGKHTLGQYSGYTDNSYIDRTRYFDTKKGKEPLPVNPDFFMKGGGTFA